MCAKRSIIYTFDEIYYMEHQSDLHIAVGKRLRKLRKEQAKLPYDEFSKRCGIAKNQYLFLEQGCRSTTLNTLSLILKFYNLSFSEFFRMVEVDIEKNDSGDSQSEK